MRKLTETLSDTSILILNEMINGVNKMTTESEISELYELIEVFIQDNFSEITFGSGELKCGMFL